MIVQPSMILRSLKMMSERFVENVSFHRLLNMRYKNENEKKNEKYFEFDKDITQAFVSINNSIIIYNNNKYLWKNNSKFQKCLYSIEKLFFYCNEFLKLKELYENNDFFSEMKNSNNTKNDNYSLKLYMKYINIQLKLEKYFSIPTFLYACNYTIKSIIPYPGFYYCPSVSVPINSKLYSIALYKTINKNKYSNTFLFNNNKNIQNFLPVSISNLLKIDNENNANEKFESYWWWDAIYAKDWTLLCTLLQIAKKIENNIDFEVLFYTAIQNGADCQVISTFIR